MDDFIRVDKLSVRYHEVQALKNISFSMKKGLMTGILGPNGAGKSTLMKALLGLEKIEGEITYFGKGVESIRKEIAYIPQRSQIDWDFPLRVIDLVMMGRYSHIRWFKRASKEDKEIAMQSLRKVEMEEYRHRQIGELSGGQQQRVFIARALAQKADLLFLDEPFAGIDITSEKLIIHLLKELRDEEKTLFVIHHDLSKVEDYFDQILLINQKLISAGQVQDVFTKDHLETAYQGNMTSFGPQDALVIG